MIHDRILQALLIIEVMYIPCSGCLTVGEEGRRTNEVPHIILYGGAANLNDLQKKFGISLAPASLKLEPSNFSPISSLNFDADGQE